MNRGILLIIGSGNNFRIANGCGCAVLIWPGDEPKVGRALADVKRRIGWPDCVAHLLFSENTRAGAIQFAGVPALARSKADDTEICLACPEGRGDSFAGNTVLSRLDILTLTAMGETRELNFTVMTRVSLIKIAERSIML